jgi:predicted nucleotidyltransferase
MGIILDLLEYIHGNNPRSINDIMVKSKSLLEYKHENNPRSIRIYTMSKKGKKHIRGKLKKIPQ